MNATKHRKIVRVADYVAEIDVEHTDHNEPWGPYLSVEDARKLDRVRAALHRNDLTAAQREARVYRLVPVAPAGT